VILEASEQISQHVPYSHTPHLVRDFFVFLARLRPRGSVHSPRRGESLLVYKENFVARHPGGSQLERVGINPTSGKIGEKTFPRIMTMAVKFAINNGEKVRYKQWGESSL